MSTLPEHLFSLYVLELRSCYFMFVLLCLFVQGHRVLPLLYRSCSFLPESWNNSEFDSLFSGTSNALTWI